ncbi:AAA family ATPase [archaeon]|nr:AAA family ATPase [archaeon]
MIIGITGTMCAGKGTIVEFLKSKGFKHYSVRDFLVEEIKKRELSVNRDSMILVGNYLREKNSPSYIAEKLYERAKNNGGDAIIESLRAVGEVETLKNKGNFYLFSVDAPIEVRYKRSQSRNLSESDLVSFEKFVSQEEKEMENDDPSKQNISACMQISDFHFVNDEAIEELYKQVQETLNEIQISSSKIKKVSWDDYFMSIAYLVAAKSKDESTHIGAVIVGKNNEIKSTGYNSFVRGLKDDVAERQEKPEKYFWFEHGERNAIYNATLAGLSLSGCKIYTNGVPCMDCARGIIQAGITEIIVDKKWDDKNPEMWREQAKRSIEMFEEVGVKLRYWDGEILPIQKYRRGEFI